ncbi:MAG: aminopeptidase [Gammaproteobacteria bacterium]
MIKQVDAGYAHLRAGAMYWITPLVLLLLLLCPWADLSYYAQSVTGQASLLLKRRLISSVIAEPQTPAQIKDKLQVILELRGFAIAKLGLTDNGSYLTFVDLDRRAVAWNVFATPEFSLSPLHWCFPFAGCLSYHGYFSENRAHSAAAGLSEAGNDVFVGGVSAYSTLGWFRDPVYSTMLRWSDTRIGEVILHEMAHQTVYVPGDSAFNEAFATTVATQGVRHWLAQTNQHEKLEEFDLAKRHEDAFVALVLDTVSRLRNLYASRLVSAEMRTAKQGIFTDLRERYRSVRNQWGGYSAYDEWMARDLNNAKLASIVTYREHVRAFERLFDNVKQDFREFYQRVTAIAELTPRERSAIFRHLVGHTVADQIGDPSSLDHKS